MRKPEIALAIFRQLGSTCTGTSNSKRIRNVKRSLFRGCALSTTLNRSTQSRLRISLCGCSASGQDKRGHHFEWFAVRVGSSGRLAFAYAFVQPLLVRGRVWAFAKPFVISRGSFVSPASLSTPTPNSLKAVEPQTILSSSLNTPHGFQ